MRIGAQYFPVAEVTLAGAARSLSVTALVDSGASLSVFRAEILAYLGIPLAKGARLYLEGISGRILGYRHQLLTQVGNKRFGLTVVFSEELSVSFNLLGRDNFFKQFLVSFDERGRTLRLQPYLR